MFYLGWQGRAYGLATGPGGLDVRAGGEDIDERAEVGEVREGIGLVGSADRADGGLRGGRGVGGVLGVVASGDGHEVAGAHDAGGGVVDRRRDTATEGQVDDDTLGAVAARSVADDEVHTGDDTRATKKEASVSICFLCSFGRLLGL